MMKRQIITLAIVFASVFMGVWLSAVDPQELSAAQPQDRVLKDPDASQSFGGAEQSGYYIKDYNGRVSVIRAGEEVPEMIFNIFTRTLPEMDQEQLLDGVYVESYEELTRRVEDYIS